MSRRRGAAPIGKIEEAAALAPAESLLRPGSTCWRIEPARRASVIVDGQAYFHAMKLAMRRAERSILLLGWDFDPGIQLEPDREAQPLSRLFEERLAARPELCIRILIWDMAAIFSLQRRARPQDAPKRLPKDRLEYRVDGAHPRGAAHHQKLLVVDDAIAFCGGSDFTRNRWDTPEHRRWDPRRRTASGQAFGPRHDVVMAVDGAAAAALGDLARERWRRLTGVQLPAVAGSYEVWPEDLAPDLADVPVAIARTEPAWSGRPEIREAEALHLAGIAAARRWIYLENQYFTSPLIGAALARRLAERDGPEVVVVCPLKSGGRLDRLALDHARNYLIDRLHAADRHGRFRAFAALTEGDAPITIHSKVTIIDDRLLRVGSTNLNNRALGFDTECDLAIEVDHAKAGSQEAVRAIRRILVRMVSEHLGASPERLAATIDASGSLLAGIQALNSAGGRRLAPFDVSPPRALDRLFGETSLFDPLGTADNWRPWRRRSAIERSLSSRL